MLNTKMSDMIVIQFIVMKISKDRIFLKYKLMNQQINSEKSFDNGKIINFNVEQA